MKNIKLKIACLFLFLLMPTIASAYAIDKGNSIYVSEARVIDGNYYAAGTNITIDGRVTGDVICAGQSVAINGTVDGDVICAGQSVNVSGNIGGSLRVAASDINILGAIAHGITVAGTNVNIGKTARIGWDALIAAANVQIRGELGRSLLGAGANYSLSGKTNGDVNLYLSNSSDMGALLNVSEGAVVGGRLTYTSTNKADISEKAQINGEVLQKFPSLKNANKSTVGQYIYFMVFAILSALLVGFVLVKVWPNHMQKITDGMTDKIWPTIGWGFVLAIITPFAALLISITIIGLRLAFLVMAIWLILIVISKVVAGLAIGRLLTKKYWQSQKNSLVVSMSVGVTIAWLIFYIPIIGWFISLFAIWWGFGGMIRYFKKA